MSLERGHNYRFCLTALHFDFLVSYHVNSLTSHHVNPYHVQSWYIMYFFFCRSHSSLNSYFVDNNIQQYCGYWNVCPRNESMLKCSEIGKRETKGQNCSWQMTRLLSFVDFPLLMYRLVWRKCSYPPGEAPWMHPTVQLARWTSTPSVVGVYAPTCTGYILRTSMKASGFMSNS